MFTKTWKAALVFGKGRSPGCPKGSLKWTTDRFIALALGALAGGDPLNAPGDPLHGRPLRPESLRKRFADARPWLDALKHESIPNGTEITPDQWAALRRVVVAVEQVESTIQDAKEMLIKMQREFADADHLLASLPGPRLDMTRRRLRLWLKRAISGE